MRFVILSLCLLLLKCALGERVPFVVCDSDHAGHRFTLNHVEVSPLRFTPGDQVIFSLDGTLGDYYVRHSKIQTTASVNGITFLNREGDFCSSTEGNVMCAPNEKVRFSQNYTIPNSVNQGMYEVSVSAVSNDNDSLFCFTIEFLVSPFGEVTFILPKKASHAVDQTTLTSDIPYDTCSDGDFSISDLSIQPWPPVPGQKIEISAEGTLARLVSSGKFELDLSFDGIQLLKQVGDICQFSSDIHCPQQPGLMKIRYSVDFPKYAPSGSYKATFKATDQSGASVFCILLKFHSDRSHSSAAHRIDIIEKINSAQTTWKAGVSSRFFDKSMDHVASLCGALSGGPLLDTKVFPEALRNSVAPPKEFDSRAEWGDKCPSLNQIRDQASCGSCWAMSAAETMSDRLCIESGGKEQVYLSAQDLVSCCGFSCGFGCSGGFPSGAWNYFVKTGLVTGGPYGDKDACFPYALPQCSHHVNGSFPSCSEGGSSPSCPHSCKNGANWSADKHKGVKSYAIRSSESDIQMEILQHGPVQAAFTVYEDFPNYKSGVYQHVTGRSLGGHAIKIIGWGEEDGTPYWLVANSWNVEWGDKGYFKILRGANECGIESSVVAGLAI